MKIALLTDGIYPYVIGGMQKHSYFLAKYLAKNQVYVDLYHTNQSKYDINRLEFFSEEEKRYIRSFVVDFPVLGNFAGHYIKESYEYSQRIFNLFRQNPEADYIYAKGFSGWKLVDEKRKGFKCAPVGVNFHGYEMFQKAPGIRSRIEQIALLRKPVLFNIKNADHVFSYGGRITDLILMLGVDRKNVIESPAGIDKEWFLPEIQPSGKKRRFLFIGRYERRKGVEELSSVLKDLIKKNDIHFSFIGDIPKSKRINSDKIQYFGKISDKDELKNIITANDVLVCPSYSEGMPNVILEAMSCGLAVIASDVGAVNILVSPQSGWLVKPGDKTGLKAAMTECINMTSVLLDERKSRSHANAKSFFWDSIILKLISDIKKKISN